MNEKDKVVEVIAELIPTEPFREAFPDHGDDVAHETVAQAIGDTSRAINQVKRDKRNTGQWIVFMSEGTEEEAVAYFNKPTGTPTRVGFSSLGKRMIAIWNVDGKEPDQEPVFT